MIKVKRFNARDAIDARAKPLLTGLQDIRDQQDFKSKRLAPAEGEEKGTCYF